MSEKGFLRLAFEMEPLDEKALYEQIQLKVFTLEPAALIMAMGAFLTLLNAIFMNTLWGWTIFGLSASMLVIYYRKVVFGLLHRLRSRHS